MLANLPDYLIIPALLTDDNKMCHTYLWGILHVMCQMAQSVPTFTATEKLGIYQWNDLTMPVTMMPVQKDFYYETDLLEGQTIKDYHM